MISSLLLVSFFFEVYEFFKTFTVVYCYYFFKRKYAMEVHK